MKTITSGIGWGILGTGGLFFVLPWVLGLIF